MYDISVSFLKTAGVSIIMSKEKVKKEASSDPHTLRA